LEKLHTLLPYLVPASYLEAIGNSQALLVPLGHDIYTSLVFDLDGLVQGVAQSDLDALNLTAAQAHEHALHNLERLADAQQIKMAQFAGPQDRPFILIGGHWAAATAVLLPGLHGIAASATGSEDLLASVPHREALLVFARGDRAYRDAMRVLVHENESDAPKPLTFELFSLTAVGVEPFTEP
jgi:hypothetical protein